MAHSEVAVVILNWNGKNWLHKFLPSVIKHSSNHRIIVADNNSSDNSVTYVKEHFPQVEIVLNDANYGFAKGYNEALKKISSKYYVLLNSDVEVSENWIDPIIQRMESNPNIVACQPKILSYQDKHSFEYAGASGGFIDKYGYPFCRGRVFNELELDEKQYNNVIEIFWATGACMFVRSDVFHLLHGFDEDYFAHMEEIDLCWRMKNIGHTIFVEPASVVYHVGGGTLNKDSSRKTYLNFRNNLITILKNHADKYLWIKILIRLKLDGLAGIKFLLGGKPGHTWAIVRAHFSFYAMIGSTLRKRKELKKLSTFSFTTSGIYNGSIVFDHYLKSKKKFSDLTFSAKNSQ